VSLLLYQASSNNILWREWYISLLLPAGMEAQVPYLTFIDTQRERSFSVLLDRVGFQLPMSLPLILACFGETEVHHHFTWMASAATNEGRDQIAELFGKSWLSTRSPLTGPQQQVWGVPPYHMSGLKYRLLTWSLLTQWNAESISQLGLLCQHPVECLGYFITV
jgi:hypothetical protein